MAFQTAFAEIRRACREGKSVRLADGELALLPALMCPREVYRDQGLLRPTNTSRRPNTRVGSRGRGPAQRPRALPS